MAVPVVTAPGRAVPPPSREHRSRLWAALAAPGIFWLAIFFIFPLYVVLCIVFGQVDPIFRTPVQPVDGFDVTTYITWRKVSPT